MDSIKIENLEVYCNHGVFKEENVLGQKFLVSARLFTDTHNAGLDDNLTESIHYGDVCHFITEYMKSHTFKLIESVAENLARELLLNTNNLNSVELEIKKPWAPIGLPIENVAVNIYRSWHTAYIALGSNIGDKKSYLDTAIDSMSSNPLCRVLRVSDFITTAPVGPVEQDNFLNGALKLKTLYTPHELLDYIHVLEADAKRERKIHWGPRTLDLDILLYDDITIDDDDLIIPHPEMSNRDFVMIPLKQIYRNFK